MTKEGRLSRPCSPLKLEVLVEHDMMREGGNNETDRSKWLLSLGIDDSVGMLFRYFIHKEIGSWILESLLTPNLSGLSYYEDRFFSQRYQVEYFMVSAHTFHLQTLLANVYTPVWMEFLSSKKKL